jgi:asparaginyl-tRNA synthetase
MGCWFTIRTRALFGEKHFKCPVILFDFQQISKHFTCVWTKTENSSRHGYPFPGIGEIVGGLKEKNVLILLKNESLRNWWRRIVVVSDTRRLVQRFTLVLDLDLKDYLFVTGMTNIRDVIPFPRTTNECRFVIKFKVSSSTTWNLNLKQNNKI